MPDYRSMTDAYNTRKRSKGNWVVFLCMFLLIVSFAVIVFLSSMVIVRDNRLNHLKAFLPAGTLDDSTLKNYVHGSSPILVQDSLKNVILKLEHSIQSINLISNHNMKQVPRPTNAVVTLFESRLNDTISLPFNTDKNSSQGDYTLNIQLKNILGYSLNFGGIIYCSNPAFKAALNANATLEDGGNLILPINLSTTDMTNMASPYQPVYIFITYTSFKSKGTLKIKLTLKK